MQLLIFIAIVLILLSLFFAKNESFSVKGKIAFAVSMLVLIALGWVYQSNVSTQTEQNREVLSAFKQGKTLMCGEIEVSKKMFIYVSGTLSFVPNDKNVAHRGIVIDIETCTVN